MSDKPSVPLLPMEERIIVARRVDHRATELINVTPCADCELPNAIAIVDLSTCWLGSSWEIRESCTRELDNGAGTA